MRAILAIYSLLLMNFQAFAGDKKPTLKGMMTKEYSKILEASYAKTIDKYKEHRSSPEKLFSHFNKKDAAYLRKFIAEKQITRLPKLISYKDGHYLLFKGNKVFVSPSFLYDHEITFNGKKFIFDNKLSIKENSRRLQRFMGAKKVSFIDTFILDKAEAFACFGLCIGAIVLGTLIVGAYAAKSAFSVVNGTAGDLKKFREEIKGKRKQCDTDLNNVAKHSEYFSSHSKTPGSFETFGNLKKVSDYLESDSSDSSKVQEKLYKDYGLDNLKNCGEFAKTFLKKVGNVSNNRTRLAVAMGEIPEDPNSKSTICSEINEYIDCLNQFDQVHKGHVNQGDGYKENMGVYYESDAHSNSKSK